MLLRWSEASLTLSPRTVPPRQPIYDFFQSTMRFQGKPQGDETKQRAILFAIDTKYAETIQSGERGRPAACCAAWRSPSRGGESRLYLDTEASHDDGASR